MTDAREVLTTASEVESLLAGSIVMSGTGIPFLRYGHPSTPQAPWRAAGTSAPYDSDELLDTGPVTVLFRPEATP